MSQFGRAGEVKLGPNLLAVRLLYLAANCNYCTVPNTSMLTYKCWEYDLFAGTLVVQISCAIQIDYGMSSPGIESRHMH